MKRLLAFIRGFGAYASLVPILKRNYRSLYWPHENLSRDWEQVGRYLETAIRKKKEEDNHVRK